MASTGIYDAVFYGHTHIAKREIKGKTLLLNPGEIMGRFGVLSLAIYDMSRIIFHKIILEHAQEPILRWLVLDTKTNNTEIIEINN